MSKLKNFLNGFRPDRTNAKQMKTIERIGVINHSCDAIGWRPCLYTIPAQFEHFLKELDSDIDAFISKAGPDRYNARFYETTVDREVELALKELAAQHVEHKKSIHNIRIYQQASLLNAEAHLHEMEQAAGIADKSE